MRARFRVYFIRRPDAKEIKIGISTNVPRRLRHLQGAHGSPLELMGSVQGGANLEGAIHNAFADCRLMGEWFRETPKLLAYIARVLGAQSAWVRAARNEDAAAVRHIRETLRELNGKEPKIDGEIDPDRLTEILRAYAEPPKPLTLADLTPAQRQYMESHPFVGPVA